MERPARDDDPLHALDGFYQRQAQQAEAAVAAPDLDSLLDKLHPERPSFNAWPKGGKLKDGTRWTAEDVVDVPEVAMPPVDPAADAARAAQAPRIELPTVDAPDNHFAQTVAASTGQTTALAAAAWLAEARAAHSRTVDTDWQAVLQQRPKNPGILSDWRAGAWIGARRLAVPPSTDFIESPQGPVLENVPAQHLVVLWAPTRQDVPHLGRWPRQAMLSALPEHELDALALTQLPEDSVLWWLPGTSELVDWALAAEIVLIHEDSLRPRQAEALRALIEREREAAFTRMNSAYHRPATGEPVSRKG